MAIVRLRHVQAVRRSGRIYYYHRITKERLPDAPQERALRVLAINVSLASKATAEGGSVAALIEVYRMSAEFADLADLTRRDYDRHLSAIDSYRLGIPRRRRAPPCPGPARSLAA